MTDPQHPRTEQFPAATPPTDHTAHTRAEPWAGGEPQVQAPPHGGEQPATAVPEDAVPGGAGLSGAEPVGRRRGRARVALVVAAAVGLVAVGGGGFAVGRATAPDTAATSTTDQQVPGGGQFGTPPDGGRMGTPPDGSQPGTPPGQDGSSTDGTTTDGTTTDGTTSDPTT